MGFEGVRKLEDVEAEALYLFKDYSLLQLKSFLINEDKLSKGEKDIIDLAIHYHRSYLTTRLNKSKK